MSRGLFWALNRVPTQEENKWWLGNGAVTESDTYTIYDPLAAADLATSYVNLANPGTRDATAPVAAPTHAQGTGWTFNGSTQYLAATQLTPESTVIVWVEGVSNSVANQTACGAYTTASNIFYIRPKVSATVAYRHGSVASSYAGNVAGGILALNKNMGVKNGVQLVTPSTPWTTGNHSIKMFMGCENVIGTATNFMTGRILRVAIYDFALTLNQIRAVTNTMFNYNQPSDNSSYSQAVLELNPTFYYTCNQNFGSYLYDKSGNNRHGEVYYLTPGQDGLIGKAIAGNSASNLFGLRHIHLNENYINPDEYWCSVLIKVNVNAARQIRVTNFFTGTLTEYSTAEIRNGDECAIYARENGVNQATSVLFNVLDGEWHHVVIYNSLSAGKMGAYFDGVKYEVNKTTTGFVNTLVDATYPDFWKDVDGLIQHIAFFNGTPTQEQVDSINPI